MDQKSTKELIFEAAVKLFAQRGYNGTSIRELAKAVGIKESSIYNHFNGKRAILQGILDYQMNTFNNLLISSEELEKFVNQFTDPVEFWLTGVQQIESSLPPLTDTIEGILHNEIFLDNQCRDFVLLHLLPTQKRLCMVLLELLHKRKLIRKTDFESVAEQYVSMVHGLRIEARLKKLHGEDPMVVQNQTLKHIANFIERLKSNHLVEKI